MSLAWKLVIAIGVEVLYAISTRSWLPGYVDGIELELSVTGVRALTAVIYWVLFRDLILSRTLRRVSARDPGLWVGICVVCLAPVIAGNWALAEGRTQIVFAATSLVVAVREEILYRGVLQNLLERRMGWIAAIVLTNVIFTLYHYGAWPFTAQNVLEFFFVGCFVSVLYWATGSLLAAIVFHAVYDAIWCFTPFLDQPWNWAWGAGAQVLGVVIALYWALRVASPSLKQYANTLRPR